MTIILGYIKNIGFFLILVSVVCNALPENTFKKYCKLFCGLVLVVLVLTPINELLNYDGDISQIFSAGVYDAQLADLESRLKLQEQLEMDNALEQYELGIKDALSDIASKQGLYILDVDVDYSYTEDMENIQLDRVSFQVTNDETGVENIKIQGINGVKKIEKIEIENIGQVADGSQTPTTDIDNLSHADRPKVIKFIEEAANRLKVDESYISVEWKE